jgi:hypothetical protein
MSERHHDNIARSSAEGPVPGQTAIEIDREIQFRQLLWMGLALVATAAFSGVIVFFMLRGFLRQEQQQAGAPPPMVAPPVQVPGARLLARPERELERVREAEAEQIAGYGWVDQSQGLARIPIDRALEIVASKGLPSRAPVAAPVGPAGMDTTPESGFRPPISPAGAAAPAAPTQPPPAAPRGGPPRARRGELPPRDPRRSAGCRRPDDRLGAPRRAQGRRHRPANRSGPAARRSVP